MTLKAAGNLVFRYGRRFFCDVLFGKTETKIAAENCFLRATQEVSRESGLIGKAFLKSWDGGRPDLAQRFLRWVTNSPAAELRRNAAKKLAYGGRQLTPYLGFVGINLLSGHGIVTKKDELEVVCEEIRVCLDSIYRAKNTNLPKEKEKENEKATLASSLDDLELGQVVAQGCNAIVHSAKWKEPKMADLICGNSAEPIVEEDKIEEQSAVVKSDGRFGEYNLAVKMMFNYEAESNATTILRVMSKEIVPAKSVAIGKKTDLFKFGSEIRKKILPPHPHVVDMLCAFTDRVPSLPGAMALYPDALPRRLNEGGCGRNMTLFIVMQRYDCSLQQYLSDHVPSPTTRLLLLLQLLEGIVHMTRHGVAHRDLKSDNVLLDLSEGLDCPHLVITDFGTCLANQSSDLRLHFTSDEIERGGNYALMAPEVSCAEPGSFSMIDYSRSDLWTAGTLAYEIYGSVNPFYESSTQKQLDTHTYTEEDLPQNSEMPNSIGRLVRAILQRNPKNRPSPAVAANVCHILLWGPQSLISGTSQLSDHEILDWLVTEAAISVFQSRGIMPSSDKSSPLFTCIRNIYLSRVHMNEIEESLKYFTV